MTARLSQIYAFVATMDKLADELAKKLPHKTTYSFGARTFEEVMNSVIADALIATEEEWAQFDTFVASALEDIKSAEEYPVQKARQIKRWLIDNVAMKDSVADVVNAVRKNGGKIVDDHNDLVVECIAVGRFVTDGGKVYPVFLMDKIICFCLNEMYIEEDGIAHVSRRSVGGLVYPTKYASLEEACKAYAGIGKLTEIVRI